MQRFQTTASARPLRAYQEQCVELTLHTPGDSYYVLPTGGGKTRVAAELINRLCAEYDGILFLAHRQELIYQTARGFQEDCPGLNIGVCMGAHKELSADVVVGTIQTLSRGAIVHFLSSRNRVLCLIDEAQHITPTNAYGACINQVRKHNVANRVLACSATPFRADNKPGLSSVIPVCSFHRSIEDLQSLGYLAPTRWMPVHVEADLSSCKTSSLGGESDYREDELSTILFPTIHEIVEKSLPLIERRKAIVFCPSVDFSQALAEAYCERMESSSPLNNLVASPAMAVWGDMPRDDREWILSQWKTGPIQIVVNCALLTEGFDFPNIGAVVVVRPTQSPGLYLQMIGRGTRPKSGVPWSDCRIIDIVGNANLLETNQVVLPKVLEAISERDEYLMMNPRELDTIRDMGLDENDLAIRSGCSDKSYKILDPLSKSWIAWGREPGYYYASLGNESLAVAKKDVQSGLYQGYILTATRKDEKGHVLWREGIRREAVTKAPTTLNSLMGHLNHVIAANGIRKLIDKDARWREKPASEGAMKYLCVLNRQEGQRAQKEHWTAGYVAQRICYYQVSPLVERL